MTTTIPTGKVDAGTAFVVGRNWTSPQEHMDHAIEVFPVIYGFTLFMGLLPALILGVGLSWALICPKVLRIMRIFPAVAPRSQANNDTQTKQILKLSEARRASKHLIRVSFLWQIGWFCTALTLFPTLSSCKVCKRRQEDGSTFAFDGLRLTLHFCALPFRFQRHGCRPARGQPLLWLGLVLYLSHSFSPSPHGHADHPLPRCLLRILLLLLFPHAFPSLPMTSSSIDVFTLKTGPSWVAVTIAEVISNALCVFCRRHRSRYRCCPARQLSARVPASYLALDSALLSIVSVFGSRSGAWRVPTL